MLPYVKKITVFLLLQWAIPEKFQTGGVEDMGFPGVSKK